MPSAASVQVTEVLRQRYFPIMSALSNNWTPEQHEKNRLSRSLAAFAIEEFGGLVPAQAAYKVCDGGNLGVLQSSNYSAGFAESL